MRLTQAFKSHNKYFQIHQNKTHIQCLISAILYLVSSVLTPWGYKQTDIISSITRGAELSLSQVSLVGSCAVKKKSGKEPSDQTGVFELF